MIVVTAARAGHRGPWQWLCLIESKAGLNRAFVRAGMVRFPPLTPRTSGFQPPDASTMFGSKAGHNPFVGPRVHPMSRLRAFSNTRR